MSKQAALLILIGLFIIPLYSKADIQRAIRASSFDTDKKNSVKVNVEYIPTKKGPVVDTYFGVNVPDPYRWLEDDRSSETKAWVDAQNKQTFTYLEAIPYRDAIKSRLETKSNYARAEMPFKEGEFTYVYRNDGLQNQDVLWRTKEGHEPEVFLDPNVWGEGDSTSLGEISFSNDGTLAAYATSEKGSDWRKIIIIDTHTKKVLESPLVNVKFSGISWIGSKGFYYSSYDKPEGSELTAQTDQHKLYFHQLGQPQSSDTVIFGALPEQKRRYVFGSVTEDERYLIVSAAQDGSRNDLYVRDLAVPNSPFVSLLDGIDSKTYVFDNIGNQLFLMTDYRLSVLWICYVIIRSQPVQAGLMILARQMIARLCLNT